MEISYKSNTLPREFLSPPGEDIQEAIEALGMSQQELAERMGRNKNEISDLLKGKRPLTLTTAQQLERVLGTPVEYWLERERLYRLELAKLEEAEQLGANQAWAKRFPLKQMMKHGWIAEEPNKADQVKNLLQFFAVANPKQWETIYADAPQAAAFRLSLANVHEPEAVSVWLRQGERELDAMSLPDFDKKALKQLLPEIKEKLVLPQPADFAAQLKLMCQSVGLALVYTPCLPKAPINGVARWVHNKPLIQLSDRYKRADIFWFSFFHEVGHILLHGRKEVFLEGLKNAPLNQEKEAEADDFAANALVDPKRYEALDKKGLNQEKIKNYAAQLHTHPGILVGRLQHEGHLTHTSGQDLRVKIELF